MQINEKLQIILMELRSRLENLYGDRLVKIMLYGSQARGEEEGRRKKEEGRRKREEGKRKKEEGRGQNQ